MRAIRAQSRGRTPLLNRFALSVKFFASSDRERRMIGFVRALTAVGSVLGLSLAISGLARSESCPSKCTSGMVPLGVMAPISGPSAAFGQPAAKAIEIAVGSLNAAGGLLGVPVERLVGDDRCDA